VLPGPRSNWSVVRSGDGFLVLDRSNANPPRVLTNVKRLRFADGAVALDVDDIAGRAYRLYQAAFDRQPDLAGLGFWIGRLDQQASLEDVAAAFLGSAEFRDLYGANPSNDQLVRLFYNHVLHREPDRGGYAFWKDLLDQQRLTPAQVLISFSDSPENQLQVTGSVQNGIDFTP
jgi:serralysin